MRRRRHGEPYDLLRRALRMAAGSHHSDDLLDVGRYVASRGSGAVEQFSIELEAALVHLREIGAVETLRDSSATLPDGRGATSLTAPEVDGCLQFLMVDDGPQAFDDLLGDPSAVLLDDEFEDELDGEPYVLHPVDLRTAVDAALARHDWDGPLWQEQPGDLRRDGLPWLMLGAGFGVGVSQDDEVEPPADADLPVWDRSAFHRRFSKAEVTMSLDDGWRRWRDAIGARQVDVAVEWSFPHDERERVEVRRRRKAVEVTVHRDAAHLTVDPDPRRLAELEIAAVLRLTRDALDPDGSSARGDGG